MSWAETLKINGNIRKPLDKLSYELFYNLAVVQNNGYGATTDDVFIVSDGTETIVADEYKGASFKVVILPPTVVNISDRAFADCPNLSTVVIPEGVQVINALVFRNCTSLKCVRLPSTIETISDIAFVQASTIEHIYVPWSEGMIENAPWGATNAVVHYNS